MINNISASNSVWFLSAILLFAMIFSTISVRLLVRLAPRIGLLDRPNERSSHFDVTPRGGGIGVVGGVVLIGGVILILGGHGPKMPWVVYFGAALGVALISLWDDFRSLNAGIRFACHLMAACAVVLWTGTVNLTVTHWSFGPFPMAYIMQVLLVFWIVGLTNTYNFMDGIDGIAGLQGIIAGAAWGCAGVLWGGPAVAAMGVVLAGCCIGFLVYNWSPAKIFMGDVGSAFLGFCLSALPVVCLGQISEEPLGMQAVRVPVFAVMVVWPFIADGAFTLCRRIVRLEQVWKAHRSHLYQRMVQAGLRHATVALYYGFWAAVCSVAGLYYLTNGSLFPIISTAYAFWAITWLLTICLERIRLGRCSGALILKNRRG